MEQGDRVRGVARRGGRDSPEPRTQVAGRAVLPGRALRPARARAEHRGRARPACSTSATSPSTPSAPTPTAKLTTASSYNVWVVLPIAIAIAMLAGVVLGAPTLRLRGDYLAIVTLGFGEIVRIVAQNTDALGEARGITGIPHPTSFLGLEFGRPRAVLLPHARGDRARRRDDSSTQRIAGRPGVGRHPRGRGRRRADGRAHVQVEAVGVRHGRLDRRPGRLDLRQPRSASSARTTSRSSSPCSSWRRSSSAAWARSRA